MTQKTDDSKRRTRADGERTKQLILETAVRLATIEGLDGLSIGKLATATGVSKSGVYAHFDSKEDLQLATVDTARTLFIDVVVVPALEAEGLDRLRALCESFLSYVEHRTLPGGCFFAAAAAELGGRSGPLKAARRGEPDGTGSAFSPQPPKKRRRTGSSVPTPMWRSSFSSSTPS